MNIARYAIQNKIVTLIMTVVMVVGGLVTYKDLSRLEDPEYTIKEAMVITRYPGASPEEVEQEVTEVLEREIQRMGQVSEIRSLSKAGVSMITVEMKDKYDKFSLPAIWQELRSKVGDAQGSLPPGAEESQVQDDFGDVFGVLYAVTGDGFNSKEIYEHAKFLQRELSLVPDVAKVDLWGEQQEAIYVEFSREKLASLGISQDEVYQKLQQQNSIVPAGSVRVGRDYVRIDARSGIGDVDDIGAMILRESSQSDQAANLIYLRDVATVTRENISPARKILRFNGQPAVALAISTIGGGNVMKLGDGVQTRLLELQEQTPIGLEVSPIAFQPDVVKKAIDGFVVSLMQALIIVIVVLLLFMGLRAGLIIGGVLLVTVVATFIFMGLNDVALERISLGALIIALGMLVDNAIVITEGMMVRIQSGMNRLKAAEESVGQTIWPLLGATLIAILAFAAIGTSEDSTGEFCRSLFQVMLYSLLLSWVTAITITPLLCYWFIPAAKAESGEAPVSPYDSKLFHVYRSLLENCMNRRWLTVAVLVGLMVLAVFGFSQLKGSFFPKSTTPKFLIHYWLPEGSDIRKTSADLEDIEAFVMGDERVSQVSTFVGAGAPRFMLTYPAEKSNSSYGMLLIDVDDHRDIGDLMAKFGDYIQVHYPDAQPKLQRLNLGPSPASSFEVKFTGPDPEVLRDLAEQVKYLMRESGGVAIKDNWRQRVKVVRPVYEEYQAQFAGVDRADLNEALETNFTGALVGVFRESDELIPIYSRAPEQERKDVSQIGNIQIWSPGTRSTIQINQVVSGFNTGWEDAQIHRVDRKRTIIVGGEPAEGELPSELFERMEPKVLALDLPVGYEMKWGGEFASSSDAQGALAGGIPMMAALMMIITVVLFNSLRHPLIIWLTVPLALIGVAAGLLVTNEPFGFMPLLGFLSLSGMLIKNAIVLLDQINLELSNNDDAWEGVIQASLSRCRPVMMAAGTTVLGMLPLLMDDFFVGMAVTIMAGLTFASVLTLIVVPVFYVILFKIKPAAAQ
jgi:multidrug efflux pump subunit AcrB